MDKNFHFIETKIYNGEGELLITTSSYVPGEYQHSSIEEDYLKWLEDRKA